VFRFVYSYSVYTNIFTNTKLANKGTNNAKTLALLVFIKPAARLLVRMRASRALLVSSFVDHPGNKHTGKLTNTGALLVRNVARTPYGEFDGTASTVQTVKLSA